MIDIKERARKIKLLLLDVDGVLTDGRIVLSSCGREIKNFNVNDGLGILLVKRASLKCAIITAKSSSIVRSRVKNLGIDKIYENHYKIKSFAEIQKRFRVNPEEICFVGDDLIDMPILTRVGLAVSVPNAVREVREKSHYITQSRGGFGAVREVCEVILKAQGKWEEVTREYFK